MKRKRVDEEGEKIPGPDFSSVLMEQFGKCVVGVDWGRVEFSVVMTARRLSRGFEIKDIKIIEKKEV